MMDEPASACAMAGMARNGGATITSRSRASVAASRSSSPRRAATNARPSTGVMFIFQLPANSFLRIGLSEFLHERPNARETGWVWLTLERLYSGQFDSFEVFEGRAAAGRNMCEARRPRLMSYRRRSVAASEHARDAVEARDRLADLERALRERRNLEEAQRAVPDHGFRAGQPLDEFGDRPRSDIEAHLVGRNVIYDICRRLGFRGGCDDVVARQHERHTAARRLPHQLTC